MNIDNAKYIENLKEQTNDYANISVQNNYLIVKENSIDNIYFLGNVDLSLFNKEVFKLPSKDMFYIINCTLIKLNDKNKINKSVIYMNKLFQLPECESEHFGYIDNYLSDYYKRQDISKEVAWDDDIDKLEKPIIKSYDESDKVIYFNPAPSRVRENYENHLKGEFDFKNNNTTGGEKAKQRSRKNGAKIVEFPTILENKNESSNLLAGFMSATLIISITISLAIVIAIVIYSL